MDIREVEAVSFRGVVPGRLSMLHWVAHTHVHMGSTNWGGAKRREGEFSEIREKRVELNVLTKGTNSLLFQLSKN